MRCWAMISATPSSPITPLLAVGGREILYAFLEYKEKMNLIWSL